MKHGTLIRYWLFLICAAVIHFTAKAHFCDVPELTVGVGQTLSWRITADMTEEQTIYTPTLTGSNNVAQIFPSQEFVSRHGDFVITGVSPGTNVLSVKWVYVGNGNSAVCTVRIIVVEVNPTVVYPTVPREGSLVGAEGLSVPADWLRSAIDRFIPPESQKLLVLSQCYSGNVAIAPSFKDAPNTCILAATVANQTGKYGGYHDDAARALRPEAGRTARTVHEAGVKGRQVALSAPHGVTNRWLYKFENSEWPTTGGTLAPESFSLDPITPVSQVQSRHIVVFMGEPETATNWVEIHDGITIPTRWGEKTLFDDNADRDAIVANFAGQPNTTVRTVGGKPSPNDTSKGSDGWEFPATTRALSRAIAAVGTEIRNSENPAREQFILFVGDHGGLGFRAPRFRTNVIAKEKIFLPERLNIVGGEDALYRLLSRDPNSTPLVKVNVEPAGNRLRATATSFRLEDLDLSGPFSLRLIEADTGDALVLDAWSRVDFDWDEDARVDDSAHEFVGLVFPVGEELLFSRFLGKELVVEFENGSAENLVITGLELDYGNVPRTSYRVPPPRIQNLKVADLALEFEMEALQFETYIVERSTDLQVWTPVLTNQPFSEITSIRLPVSGSEAGSYRLRWQESSP